MTGGRKECLVIVEGDEVEDEGVDPGMGGAEERLGAPRTLLELQPDDRGLRSPLRGLDEVFGGQGAQSDGGSRHRTEAHEIAAGYFPNAR